MMKKVLVTLLLVGLLSLPAHALVYVDALGGEGGNTVNAATGSATDWFNTDNAIDGLWRLRTGFGNNDSQALGAPGNEIYEATGTTAGEDALVLITTVSGLTPGQLYQVDVVYWSSNDSGNNQSWAVRAGFSADAMAFYDRLGLEGATAGTWTGKQEGDRLELLGLIGNQQADGNGQIRVYIDDKPAAHGFIDRTWYDGLAVEAVPEPATLAVLGLGALFLRRKR